VSWLQPDPSADEADCLIQEIRRLEGANEAELKEYLHRWQRMTPAELPAFLEHLRWLLEAVRQRRGAHSQPTCSVCDSCVHIRLQEEAAEVKIPRQAPCRPSRHQLNDPATEIVQFRVTPERSFKRLCFEGREIVKIEHDPDAPIPERCPGYERCATH
jgi:hypothetical protein